MGQLYVYEPWPTAVDTLGLCGPLVPTSAKCTQEKNGDFRLDIDHPIDQWGKWSRLVNGNLIRADVPVRSAFDGNGTGGFGGTISMRVRTIKSTATREQCSVYSTGNGSGYAVRLAVLSPGDIVHQTILPGGTWVHIRWPGGHGWIVEVALDAAYVVANVTATIAGLEARIPSPKSRPQLFRIYNVQKSQSGGVSVQARHVSYDLLGAVTNATGGAISGETAMNNIQNGTIHNSILSHAEIILCSNISTVVKDVVNWTRVSPIEAVMSPSNGVLSYWKAELMRDNWCMSVIESGGVDAGFRVDYGLNLRGVQYSSDENDIISQLLPIGQTSKGKPLTIPNGTYTVDGVSVTVANGLVTSANDTYPIPHIGIMDKGSEIKATGTDSTALNAAYVKLIRAAKAKFAEEQCDLPQLTINVDFINLGDTAEYAQYKDLQKLFLYDTVRVKHPRLGIDVTTKVNKMVWNCILGQCESIELGSVRKNYARSRIAGWMVPGFDSLKSYVDTVSGLI